MNITFYNAGIPEGNYQLFITIVGAIIGIVCGIIIGRFGVYTKMNITNNFTAKDEVINQNVSKKSALPMLLGSILFLAAADVCGYAAYQAYIQHSSSFVAVLMCVVMFGIVGISLFISAVNAK